MSNPFSKRIVDKKLEARVVQMLKERPPDSRASVAGQRKAIGKSADGKDILMDFVSFVPPDFPGETMLVPYAAIRVGDNPPLVMFQSQGEALYWTTCTKEAEPLVEEMLAVLRAQKHDCVEGHPDEYIVKRDAAMAKAAKFLALLKELKKKVPAMAVAETKQDLPCPACNRQREPADDEEVKTMSCSTCRRPLPSGPRAVEPIYPGPVDE